MTSDALYGSGGARDVDYSGAVDGTDYNLIDYAFVSQSGYLRRAVSYLDGTDRSANGMGDASLQEVMQHFEQFGNEHATDLISHVAGKDTPDFRRIASPSGPRTLTVTSP